MTATTKLSFWQELEIILGVAKQTLPAIAAVNTASNPAATNNGVANVAAAIDMVTPLVQAGDAISAQQTTPLTGAQKLQNALSAVDVAVGVGSKLGLVSQPAVAYVAIITAAINGACAARDAIQAAQQGGSSAVGGQGTA